MIAVPAIVTIESIESALLHLIQRPDALLSIPSSLHCRSILASASYIQFILTWGRISSSRELVLTVRSEQEIPFLAKSAETLIPILLASRVSIKRLDTGETAQIEPVQLRSEGLNLFSQLQGGQPIQLDLFGTDEFEVNQLPRKGSRVHLLAADIAGDHCFPNWFYRGPRETRQMRNSAEFSSLARSTIKLIGVKSASNMLSAFDGILDDLGAMLFELVDNTHRWGRHGLKNELLQSIRGVLFDVRYDYPGNHTRLADIASDIPLINDFISFHQRHPATSDLGLLEISVFDGGIGIPSRELERCEVLSPTLADEYDATIACLKKWGTTSGQKGRGLGLDRVLELTSKLKGFVYLRTGRLKLYRDFANKPDAQHVGPGEIEGGQRHQLENAFNDSDDLVECPSTKGTLFSIVLPFNASLKK